MDCGSAAPVAGVGPGTELPVRSIYVAFPVAALAREGVPEGELLVPGGQSRQLQAHKRLEDSRTR